ncbi:MAG: DNA-directed RNA polymerase subunit beta [Candidatus Poribacteria bacterium]
MSANNQFCKRERLSFAKIGDIEETLPDLVEIQRKSYDGFLQRNVASAKRESVGLQAMFEDIFPIDDFNGITTLDFIEYSLGTPKYDIDECQYRGFSYSVPLKAILSLTLREGREGSENDAIIDIKESEVYMGDLPLMTENGTFVINGAERVIVSQLHRSPGSSFGQVAHPSGHKLLNAKIIPYRGAWIEFEYDIKDLIYVRLDRRKKMFVTILLRAIGWETDEEILKLFAKTEEVSTKDNIEGRIIAGPVVDTSTGEILAEPNTEIDSELLEEWRELGVKIIEVLDVADAADISFLRNTLAKDIEKAEESGGYKQFSDNPRIKEKALIEIFRKLRPGDPPTLESARSLFEKMYFDPVRFDLADVGRHKLNNKLGDIDGYKGESEEDPTGRVLRNEDIVATLKYMLKIQSKANIGDIDYTKDDIDHLGNRRVRAVGELIMNQVRVGLLRVARATREKMTISQELEDMTPVDIINPKPLSAAIKDFFGSSQLSQFMQQINPLDALTHKRRLSALGPGGLHRERATFEVRDVHRTHYGRVCPIETPEGPSVGLIVSLGTYARVNKYGFLETPYRVVKKGRITNQTDYLTADKEDQYVIAQANTEMDDKGNLIGEEKDDRVMVRLGEEFVRKLPQEVDYIDVSPKQIVGVSAALIPFLEHDDANRALMGSNMQRQAVPLILPKAPLVGTGMEYKAATDSGAVVLAKQNGIVERVSASEIIVRTEFSDFVDDGEQSFSEMGYDTYKLQNFKRTNNATCYHQRPCVEVGEVIKQGETIADGASTELGELALGNNLLVAFMPWEGYNFEDAILLSESLVQDDILTSIHIDEFEVEARDTKMGNEEITNDIPNLSEEALSQLDDEGIIRVGSIVEPGIILVGKVTPKAESDLGPEEKLLRAIFGEKVGEYRDASSYAKPGVQGVIIDVKVFSRKEKDKDRQTQLREDAKVKEIEQKCQEKCAFIRQRRDEEIHNKLIGQMLTEPIHDGIGFIAQTGDIITQELLDTVQNKKITLNFIFVEDQDVILHCQQIQELANLRIAAHTHGKDDRIQKLRRGDELKPGVIKLVKVYIANRRKISVGDKMAGRHGNKGVVAKILPKEDMPYLEDGTPIDVVLNPLGVPSRMNVGQVLETHLGWAAHQLGLHIATPVFDGATEGEIAEKLEEAGLPRSGKTKLYDGRTGISFYQDVTVGYAYMMKLNHLVDDKIHARSTGPYSLVTQQPLGGKAQQGGQRLGEMEVWALEAYGAAYTLQELLTIKSDDVNGRSKIYETVVKGENAPRPGTPESFNVLIKELQSLCLDVNLGKKESEDVNALR